MDDIIQKIKELNKESIKENNNSALISLTNKIIKDYEDYKDHEDYENYEDHIYDEYINILSENVREIKRNKGSKEEVSLLVTEIKRIRSMMAKKD